MKATLRRDGERRFTWKISQPVGLMELITAAKAILLNEVEEYEDPLKRIHTLRKGEIERRLRSELGMHGSEFWWRIADEWPWEERDDEVERRVRTLYPELEQGSSHHGAR